MITQHAATAELYIDRGDADENQSVFDSLHEHKGEIETAYGGDLSWEPLGAWVSNALRWDGVIHFAGWCLENGLGHTKSPSFGQVAPRFRF